MAYSCIFHIYVSIMSRKLITIHRLMTTISVYGRRGSEHEVNLNSQRQHWCEDGRPLSRTCVLPAGMEEILLHIHTEMSSIATLRAVFKAGLWSTWDRAQLGSVVNRLHTRGACLEKVDKILSRYIHGSNCDQWRARWLTQLDTTVSSETLRSRTCSARSNCWVSRCTWSHSGGIRRLGIFD